VKQGMLGDSRASYWKFLLDAATRYRHAFGAAVTLAIMGYHFFYIERTHAGPFSRRFQLCTGLRVRACARRVQTCRAPFHILATEQNTLSHLGGGDTRQLVLFQVALGTLLIDILVGGELRGDLTIRSGTGLNVFAMPGFENSLQLLAD
jgi:hypothetical protein